MEEKRNYIEQTQARARAIEGKDLSPDEMAREFAKSDVVARVDILDAIDRDLVSGGELSVRKAAELHQYMRALQNTHHTLRKVGR